MPLENYNQGSQHFIITTFMRSLFDYCDGFLKFRGLFRKLFLFIRLENLVYQNNLNISYDQYNTP